MPKTARPKTAVLAFQLAGCEYQPPAGDQTWTGQLLAARPGAPPASAGALRPRCVASRPRQLCLSARRQQPQQQQSAQETDADTFDVLQDGTDHARYPPLERLPASVAGYPSPLPERALKSAKLAALHARLSLPSKIPLQTLARALVDGSADENPQFNNSNLAFVGHTLITYHVAEWLMCHYPRLPMSIVFSAVQAYAGDKALHQVARSWGVETAAAPGGEVDPGLLQFSLDKPTTTVLKFGYKRTEAAYLEKFKWRRGISSRVVFDDDFGGVVKSAEPEEEQEDDDLEEAEEGLSPSYTSYGTDKTRQIAEKVHANFARATIGAVYAHCGREAAKAFINAHIMSRTLDLSNLFAFKHPTRELALLCAREDFDHPVARLLSETGRMSRTPVFVVGIYSGTDKLGEGAGPSLDLARFKAAMNSLKAWYLYSPGGNVRVPSDMLVEDAKPWEPAHIDIGEIISR
ncbi:ribonuclease III domain-containing protein [Podospora appendiculata]|uniref:Large ribosomal subunit protein mL44 n=1 Tax=Podospora appendiculata TaxID=314037 RepID=A0AAE0X9I3_9PEZI|nr:ribonuclease III domain-containing protein [Podospora appendiculata]